MTTKDIASVNFEWDEFGLISHSMQLFVTANAYQKTNRLLLSVVLLTGNQLGILSPRYSAHSCERLFHFLDGLPLNPEPILYPLSKARITLIQKNRTMVCTFDPTFIREGSMEPAEAVSRLLGNLPPYLAGRLDLSNRLDKELDRKFRLGLLSVVYYYLFEALPKGLSRGLFSRKRFKQTRVQFDMLGFVESIFPQWSGGLNFSTEVFIARLEEAKSQYKYIVS